MATTEQRVFMSLDSETLETIKKLAKKSKTSISKICAKFVAKQLEEDEDAYWMKIINEEKKKGIEAIDHDEFWQHLDELDNV